MHRRRVGNLLALSGDGASGDIWSEWTVVIRFQLATATTAIFPATAFSVTDLNLSMREGGRERERGERTSR
jgi:hypothetical protein